MTDPQPEATVQDTADTQDHKLVTETPLMHLELLQPSPTNPRKRFNAESIAELAETIAQMNVLQPILARPRPGAVSGEVPLEIVAGERRWRACVLLTEQGRNPHGQHIPCLVRALTTAQVLAMQLTENIHRVDLHPLEEADHYALMRVDAESPMTVAQIAAAAKVSEARVYERLALRHLVPAAREAFMADRLTLALARQVARLPQAVQPELTQHLANWGGEPMGPKAAAAFIRDRYMLRLGSAPFDAADATLYPTAGACGECPKRSGANPQLFADITEADTCTDTACFTIKKIAQRERLVAELEDSGYTVLQHDAARAACTADGRGLKPGLHALEDTVPHSLGDPTLKIVDVLTRAQVPNQATRAIDHPGNPVITYAVPTAELEDALRKLKVHRAQLDKAAAKAAGKAPAPAKATPPAAAEPEVEGGPDAEGEGDGEALDAMGQPLANWHKVGSDDAPSGVTIGDDSTAPSDDLVAELLAFTPPATSGGNYGFRTPAQYQAEMECRAVAIQVAAEVVRSYRQDTHLLPSLLELAWLLNRMAIEGGELVISYADTARLMGRDGDEVGSDAATWAAYLPADEACLLAVLQVCLQHSSGDDGFQCFAPKVAELCDISMPGLQATARASVHEHMQLGAIKTGKAKAPRKPATAKATP